jgi:hypothetical protein
MALLRRADPVRAVERRTYAACFSDVATAAFGIGVSKTPTVGNSDLSVQATIDGGFIGCDRLNLVRRRKRDLVARALRSMQTAAPLRQTRAVTPDAAGTTGHEAAFAC